MKAQHNPYGPETEVPCSNESILLSACLGPVKHKRSDVLVRCYFNTIYQHPTGFS